MTSGVSNGSWTSAAGPAACLQRFVLGNFFESVPPASDLVMLSRILHDWDDERAVVILRQCERAIEPGGRLLVMDQLMNPGSNRATNTVIADLQMLAMHAGRERTESEFGDLLATAGLQLQATTPMSSGMALLEADRP